jgi:integrase/recombinase XerD
VIDLKNTGSKNTFVEFTKWQTEQGKADGTIKTYVGVLEKFQSWLNTRNIILEQISKDDVQLFMYELEKQQKSAATIEKYLAAISVFSRFLERSDIIEDVQRKEKVQDNEIPESLTESEEKQLLKDVEADGNLRNTAIVYTLLYTGIRISELCALNIDDIKMNEKKRLLVVKNNNGEIDREIPLSKELIKHLKQYINSLDTNGGALFISSVNKRISTRAVQYMLQKYDVNPHKLRHTFCQKLINKGIDIHTVAKLAGHKDVNVTKRYASDLVPDLTNAIDQAFS